MLPPLVRREAPGRTYPWPASQATIRTNLSSRPTLGVQPRSGRESRCSHRCAVPRVLEQAASDGQLPADAFKLTGGHLGD